MPNTKSAEKRTRSSARQQEQNKSAKSRVRTLERKFTTSLSSGKKEDAAAVLPATISAFDKAAKKGVIHWRTADRKKSRLSLRLAAAKRA